MTNLVNAAKSQWNSTNQIDSNSSFTDNVIMTQFVLQNL